jgi:hypothetical protein
MPGKAAKMEISTPGNATTSADTNRELVLVIILFFHCHRLQYNRYQKEIQVKIPAKKKLSSFPYFTKGVNAGTKK